MMNKNNTKKMLEKGLSHSLADETEILFIQSNGSLSRFANSQIHQSTNRKDDYLQVRAVIGKKIGIASTNQVEDIKETVDKAHQAAKLASENTDFVSLPQEGSIEADDRKFFPKTAEFGPEERAQYIKIIIDRARDYLAAGIFETSSSLMAIANTKGIFSYQKQTEAELNAIYFNDNESSYAYSVSCDVNKINPEAVAAEAFEIIKNSKNPTTIEPGKYTVILKPAAVAEMLGLLAYSGFGAMEFQEKRSFMNKKIGKAIMAKNITLADNVRGKDCMGWFFDYEGVERKKVDLITKGVAKDVVYDSFTAARGNHKNTGHALPATSKHGPVPLNLVLETGENNLEDLIGSTQKGVLVNRFHYTNLENPMKTIFTGMTRDGTFLIENGKITKTITNMRFTQSIVKALLEAEALTKKSVLTPSFVGYYSVPALKIKEFNFSSATIKS